MASKKYVMLIVSLLYTFMILNLALWHFVVKDIFIMGSLNRMGNIITTSPLTAEKEYSKHHTEFKDYIISENKESFDLITIGDSFSNGGGYAYYQDYLEDRYGIKCLNIRFKNYCLEDLYVLIQSGMLDEVKPKAIILEKVERGVQNELGKKEINPKANTHIEAKGIIRRSFMKKTAKSVSTGIFPPVMMNANQNFIISMILRITDHERLSPEVYIIELKQNFFTNPGYERTLLYYYVDLDYLNNPLNASMVNHNLNNAAKILREKNIQLIFFAGVDKYDLYYPYIINHNGRPENNFFPEMRKVSPKEYVFIDTMKILREALERGEQDIYWLGDTHWSWKGAELISDELVKYFDWLN